MWALGASVGGRCPPRSHRTALSGPGFSQQCRLPVHRRSARLSEDLPVDAVECMKYGPPEVLQLRDLEKPWAPARCATAVTSSDCIVLPFADGKRPKVVRRTYATSFLRSSYPTTVSPGRHFAHESVRRRTG